MESVIYSDEDKLHRTGLPDYDEHARWASTIRILQEIMEQNRQQLNASQPAYCRLSSIELREEEFEKTPKRSIKRYLYTR
jgi:long-chain acyl-CoA synthetase